ncbi:MAG: hypothetical protein KGL39_60095, partial [Patescibacteria group bacterium]|nr:hypothetical protein [Patescibacteria group bacterium]
DPTERFGASDENEDYPCPYGAPGDRLWVRETFAMVGRMDINSGEPIACGPGEKDFPERDCVVAYRANSNIEFCDGDGFMGEMADRDDMPKWRPSIHMPRWASRITLEVTGVRVERVHDICGVDALAEGVEDSDESTAPMSFAQLWDSINAERGLGWDKNPWVWVINFRRITQ